MASHLSEELDTKVEIGTIDIRFFDKLLLENFYIEDRQQDTLLFAESLSVNINAFTFFSEKKLFVEDITLKKARFNLHRPADSTAFNIAFLDELFAPKNTTTSDTTSTSNHKKAWLLKANHLYVEDLIFNLNDELQGTALRVNLPKGKADFEVIDPDKRVLDLNNLELTGVQVRLRKGKTGSVKLQEKKKTDKNNKKWTFKFDKAQLNNALFDFDNNLKKRKEEGIDFNHLYVSDIDIRLNEVRYENDEFKGDINRLNFVEKSGFELKKFTADASISERGIELKNLDFRTPESQFGNELSLQYGSFDDFNDFPNKVRINTQLNDALFSLNDLLVFIPKLKENKFIQRNIDKEIRLNGLFKGKVNRLKGKDISIQIGDNTSLAGSFSTRDLTNPDDAFLDVKVERFQSSIQEIKAFANAKKLPSNFTKLGKLDFNGRFTGFLLDFVADGKLKTDLGRVESDLKINLRKGFENAEYSGNLRVANFDLQAWSGNDLFGKARFSGKVKGRGVTLSTADADLDATLQNFTFKGYDYENVRLDGRLTGKFFDGKLIVEEENIAMKFAGTVDFRDSLPVFDFTANIDELKLKNLNLSKQDISLKGDMKFDFSGNNIDDFVGKASVYSFDFQQGNKKYHADTVIITSEIKSRYDRILSLDSEIANATIRGEFDLMQLPAAFARFIETNYPKYAERLNISSAKLAPKKKIVLDTSFQFVEQPIDIREQDLRFSLRVRESNDLIDLLVKNIEIVEGTKISGRFSTRDNLLTISGKTPRFRIGTVDVFSIQTNLRANGSFADLKLETSGLVIGDSAVAIPPIFVTGDLRSDTLNFEVQTAGFQDVVKDLNVNGIIFPEDDYFQVSVLPSDFYIFKRKWDVSGDNYIRLGKNYIQTQNILINHENEQITLNSFGERGLKLDISNLAVNWLNEIVNLKKAKFDGTLNAHIISEDIFKLENLSTQTTIDSVRINDNYWGNIQLVAQAPNLKSPLDTRIRASMHDNDSIVVTGQFFSPMSERGKIQPNSFDFDVQARNYSVEFVKYLIADISNLRGRFDADARFWGDFKRPEISGKLNIYDGVVKINYLQTSYFINESDIDLTSRFFDLTGNTILDDYRNTATMTGGISHNHFRDFKLALNVDSEQFLLLNTEKKDNPLYYGTALGKANVGFSGPFNQTDINIVATSGENSRLTIPLTDEKTAKKVSFIEFVAKEDTVATEPKGLFINGANVNIQLEVTPQAEVLLPFDERVGDIIRGRGKGNIQLKITRTGEFSVFGDYEIQEGDYLFTYQSLINKPFRVKPGGTIRWTGDPFDATIRVNAVYDGLRVSPYNFIAEYFVDAEGEQKQVAERSTTVELSMYLVGSLLKPDIEFDINFPNIDPQIRTYTDGKLRILRDDKSELNRQVFGLIVLGNFLPSSAVSTTQQQQYITGINTLSEMLSNQLSNYLTDLLSDVVTDVGFISGIDFDVNYRLYQIEGLEGVDVNDPSTTRQQVQLGLKNYLFNDRLLINIGGNLDFNYVDTNSTLGSYIAGDFVIEYLLTADGRYKIRAYNRNETRLNLDTQVNETGMGFSYRTEFDTFSEFANSLFGSVKSRRAKRQARKAKRKTERNLN